MAWKANKQDTITTSSNKAELLALLQIAKNTIYLSYLIKAFTFHIPEALIVKCDNAQIIQLLVSKFTKLQTKLQYMDIYSHWPKQDVQYRMIHLRWVSTKKMAPDGLIKSFATANFEILREMTQIKDKKDLLALIKRKEKLRETLEQQKSSLKYSAMFGYGADINQDVKM